jgi:hypothetical protein
VITGDNNKENKKNASNNYLQKQNRQNKTSYLRESSSSSQKIWESIAKNYETIQGAQLSNSFIILIALSDVKEPLNTTQISELIAFHTRGQIYKISYRRKKEIFLV